MKQIQSRRFSARVLCLAALGSLPLAVHAQSAGPAFRSLQAMAPDSAVAGAAFTGERSLPAAAADAPLGGTRVAELVDYSEPDQKLTPEERRQKELYTSHDSGSATVGKAEFYGGLGLMGVGAYLLASNPWGLAAVGVGLFVLGVLGISLGAHDALSSGAS
jgi:hypothetical protein